MKNKCVYKLSVLCLGFLLLSFGLFAQENTFILGKSIPELRAEAFQVLKIEALPVTTTFVFETTNFSTKTIDSQPPSFLNTYDINDLAFFCKLEVKIEKKLKIPFKFRLGEVQYTERMEGKY